MVKLLLYIKLLFSMKDFDETVIYFYHKEFHAILWQCYTSWVGYQGRGGGGGGFSTNVYPGMCCWNGSQNQPPGITMTPLFSAKTGINIPANTKRFHNVLVWFHLDKTFLKRFSKRNHKTYFSCTFDDIMMTSSGFRGNPIFWIIPCFWKNGTTHQIQTLQAP